MGEALVQMEVQREKKAHFEREYESTKIRGEFIVGELGGVAKQKEVHMILAVCMSLWKDLVFEELRKRRTEAIERQEEAQKRQEELIIAMKRLRDECDEKVEAAEQPLKKEIKRCTMILRDIQDASAPPLTMY